MPKRNKWSHTKPHETIRSVDDAMKDAERLRKELPLLVQVHARDWDKVILADEIEALRGELQSKGEF